MLPRNLKLSSIQHLQTREQIRVIVIGSGTLGIELVKGILDSPETATVVGILPVSNLPRYSFLRQHETEIAISDLASTNQLKLLKAQSVNSDSFFNELRELKPHVLLVGGWGEIIQSPVLTIEDLAIINCHGSLLPKYRGACPYFAPIFNGDNTTGLTFHLVDDGIDTGDILLQKEFEVKTDETAIDLAKRTAIKFGQEIASLIQKLKIGKIVPQQQTGVASYVPEKKSEWGWIPWDYDATIIAQRLRALNGFLPLATSIDRLVIGFKSGKVVKQTSNSIASLAGHLADALLSEDGCIPGIVIRERTEHILVSTRSPEHLVVLEKPMIVPTGHTAPKIRPGSQLISIECKGILKSA